MIFGTVQRCFIWNTCVDSKFIKFIKESGTTWRKLITAISLGGTTYFTNLFHTDLRDVFRTTQCLSIPTRDSRDRATRVSVEILQIQNILFES